MSREIHQLDDRTVERIAAGEVVERPASVVKELVENSLDADADRIEVTVAAGGTEGIRVSDDGEGMSEEALRKAVEKHTTSKIEDVADLEAGVSTLGFRGEALHAIGAVSRTTITSRPQDGDRATRLSIEGGEVTDVSPAGRPPGTTVEVEDLFYNVPARRKYLKTEATEFAHVNTHVTGYALANPDVAVSLTHGDRETFATTGGGDLREAVMAVYGRSVAEAMIPVEPEDLPDGPLDGVGGLVSHPETNRASPDYLSAFINGRYVRSSTVREAVLEAYGTQLGSDRYPFAVCFLDVDPATVDVNVHPRKLEVRFADDAGVTEQVHAAVEDALLDAGLIRSSAPRGRSAPEQTRIEPGDGGEAGSVGGDDPDGADGTDVERGASGASSAPDTATASDTAAQETDSDGVATDPDSGDRTAGTPHRAARETVGEPAGKGRSSEDEGPADSEVGRADAPTGTGRSGPHDTSRKFRETGEQSRLGDGEDDPTASFDRLPSMRILGQLHDTYVVAETDDGLVLVDQHAADERVNYERLRAEFAGDTATQALADPVTIDLTAGEAAVFDAREDALARLGFRAERVGEQRVEVRTVPASVAEAGGADLLADVLGSFVADGEPAATVEAAADELLADLACYPSVTGNTSLTDGSIRDLLAALDDCKNPYACPHGRPVVIELDRAELEGRFERDYPGHGG